MSKLVGVAFVIAVFFGSVGVNLAHAVWLANMECSYSACGSASQSCAGSGGCSYCNGSTIAWVCKVVVGQNCDSKGSLTCGLEFTGTCVNGICTGGSGSGSACTVNRC